MQSICRVMGYLYTVGKYQFDSILTSFSRTAPHIKDTMKTNFPPLQPLSWGCIEPIHMYKLHPSFCILVSDDIGQDLGTVSNFKLLSVFDTIDFSYRCLCIETMICSNAQHVLQSTLSSTHALLVCFNARPEPWPPSLRGGLSYCSSKSRLFAVLALQWWNELPVDIRTAEILHTFCRKLKTHLFRLHLGNNNNK